MSNTFRSLINWYIIKCLLNKFLTCCNICKNLKGFRSGGNEPQHKIGHQCSSIPSRALVIDGWVLRWGVFCWEKPKEWLKLSRLKQTVTLWIKINDIYRHQESMRIIAQHFDLTESLFNTTEDIETPKDFIASGILKLIICIT